MFLYSFPISGDIPRHVQNECSTYVDVHDGNEFKTYDEAPMI